MMFPLRMTLVAALAVWTVGGGDQPTETPLAPQAGRLFHPLAPTTGTFEHAPTLLVDGEAYWFSGPPDGPDGARDVPGHYWRETGSGRLEGEHYNTGPFGTPQWWSSDAPDGELLYTVQGIIDTWSIEKAQNYVDSGFVHYHELVSVTDAMPHPSKVVWLRHVALTTFTLDGGPRPEFSHHVTPGVDFAFIPNGMTPYQP